MIFPKILFCKHTVNKGRYSCIRGREKGIRTTFGDGTSIPSPNLFLGFCELTYHNPKIVIVKQPNILLTGYMIIHELLHFLSFIIYGETKSWIDRGIDNFQINFLIKRLDKPL